MRGRRNRVDRGNAICLPINVASRTNSGTLGSHDDRRCHLLCTTRSCITHVARKSSSTPRNTRRCRWCRRSRMRRITWSHRTNRGCMLRRRRFRSQATGADNDVSLDRLSRLRRSTCRHGSTRRHDGMGRSPQGGVVYLSSLLVGHDWFGGKTVGWLASGWLGCVGRLLERILCCVCDRFDGFGSCRRLYHGVLGFGCHDWFCFCGCGLYFCGCGFYFCGRRLYFCGHGFILGSN